MFITIEKVLLLKQFPFLKDVSNMALSDLIAVSEEHNFSIGENLITENKTNQELYFIISGTLIRTRQNETNELTGKNVVGLDSVFLKDPATETIRVKQEGFALKVGRDKLYRTMSLHPSLAMAILNELSILIRNKKNN